MVFALGKEAENVLSSFTYGKGDYDAQYDVVLAKFESYFIPRHNIIHEHACFNQRGQRVEEHAETFIRTLYELSEHFDFGTQRLDRGRHFGQGFVTETVANAEPHRRDDDTGGTTIRGGESSGAQAT